MVKKLIDNKKVLNDLDTSTWNYMQNFENLPEPGGCCRECKKTIRVFSFKGGLCAKCYKKRIINKIKKECEIKR